MLGKKRRQTVSFSTSLLRLSIHLPTKFVPRQQMVSQRQQRDGDQVPVSLMGTGRVNISIPSMLEIPSHAITTKAQAKEGKIARAMETNHFERDSTPWSNKENGLENKAIADNNLQSQQDLMQLKMDLDDAVRGLEQAGSPKTDASPKKRKKKKKKARKPTEADRKRQWKRNAKLYSIQKQMEEEKKEEDHDARVKEFDPNGDESTLEGSLETTTHESSLEDSLQNSSLETMSVPSLLQSSVKETKSDELEEFEVILQEKEEGCDESLLNTLDGNESLLEGSLQGSPALKAEENELVDLQEQKKRLQEKLRLLEEKMVASETTASTASLSEANTDSDLAAGLNKKDSKENNESSSKQKQSNGQKDRAFEEVEGVVIQSVEELQATNASWIVKVMLEVLNKHILRIVYVRTNIGELFLQNAEFLDQETLYMPQLDDLVKVAIRQPHCWAFQFLVQNARDRVALWQERRNAIDTLIKEYQCNVQVCQNPTDPEDDLFQKVVVELPIAKSSISVTAVLRLTPNCPRVSASVFLETIFCDDMDRMSLREAASFIQRDQSSFKSPVEIIQVLQRYFGRKKPNTTKAEKLPATFEKGVQKKRESRGEGPIGLNVFVTM